MNSLWCKFLTTYSAPCWRNLRLQHVSEWVIFSKPCWRVSIIDDIRLPRPNADEHMMSFLGILFQCTRSHQMHPICVQNTTDVTKCSYAYSMQLHISTSSAVFPRQIALPLWLCLSLKWRGWNIQNRGLTLYCQKYSLACLHTHMNFSDIHRV